MGGTVPRLQVARAPGPVLGDHAEGACGDGCAEGSAFIAVVEGSQQFFAPAPAYTMPQQASATPRTSSLWTVRSLRSRTCSRLPCRLRLLNRALRGPTSRCWR